MYYRRLKSKQRTSFIERNWAVSIWHSKRSLYYYLSTDTQSLHSFQSNFRSRYQIYSTLTMSTFARTCDAIRLFDRGVVCWRSLGVNRATPRRDKIAAVLTLGCSALVSRVLSPRDPVIYAATRKEGSKDRLSPPRCVFLWCHPSHSPIGCIHFTTALQ